MHGFRELGGVRGRRLLGVFASAAVLSKKSSDSVSKNRMASQMELAPFGCAPPVKAQVAVARNSQTELAPFGVALPVKAQVVIPPSV